MHGIQRQAEVCGSILQIPSRRAENSARAFSRPKRPSRVPLLDGGRLHHPSQVFPSVEQLGEDDPEDSECLVEARLRSLAHVNAVLADGQLALQRKDSGGQYGLGQQQ